MVSKVASKPPLSIEIDEEGGEARKGKSIIYKPDNKGSAALMQNYSNQAKPGTKPGRSPIALQLTEIIEKFKPSFVEESHDQL